MSDEGNTPIDSNELTKYKEDKVKRLLLPLMLIIGLSGCETMGLSDKSASIEDRNASTAAQTGAQPGARTGAQTAAQTGTSGATTSGIGVETTGLGTATTGGQVVEARSLEGSADAGMKGMDPRKDPASPLSKRSIYFDFDSFVVKDEYRTIIEAHAAYLMKHPSSRAILQGNADSRGSREYNLALGQKRAESVRRAMTVIGVQDEQLEAVSFGEEKPRALGDTEQDYAENRRTDIVYGDE